MQKVINLKEKWDLLVAKLTAQFADGDELNMDGIIYLIGVQELGKHSFFFFFKQKTAYEIHS